MPERDTQIQSKVREWLQLGGAYPANKVSFGGVSGNWVAFGDTPRRQNGGFGKANKPNPYGPGYITSAAMVNPVGDFATVDVSIARKRTLLDRFVYNGGVPTTSYSAWYGACTQDYTNPHLAEILTIRGELNLTETSLGARHALDGDSEIMDTHTLAMLREPYEAASISMSARASTQAVRGQFGVTYGGTVQGADCGEPSNGDKWVYTGHLGVASTTAPELIYTLERGGAIVEGTIVLTGATTSEVGKAVVARGNTLIVVTDLAYYVSTIAANGVPSAFTKITTGLTLPANAPNDAYFGEEGLIIVGQGGAIYRTDDLLGGVKAADGSLSATTANLTRVRGNGRRIVAGGASGALVYSDDGGYRWAPMLSPGVVAITAVEVTPNGHVWIGAGGTAYVTRSTGAVWETSSFAGAGSGVIEEIRFATPEIGYLSHTPGAGLGRLFSTPFGGAGTFNGVTGWAIASDSNNKRVLNLPTVFGAISRIAVPNTYNQDVAANNLAVGGTQTNTTSGMIYVGRASMI